MKLTFVGHILVLAVSLPVRGAWVEILGLWRDKHMKRVAPRAGSVG